MYVLYIMCVLAVAWYINNPKPVEVCQLDVVTSECVPNTTYTIGGIQ
jgi:hypothetical protein